MPWISRIARPEGVWRSCGRGLADKFVLDLEGGWRIISAMLGGWRSIVKLECDYCINLLFQGNYVRNDSSVKIEHVLHLDVTWVLVPRQHA